MNEFNQNKEDDLIGHIFANKYHCIEKLGEGSFGIIYKVEYNGDYYAMKLEKKELDYLENEASIMNYLKGPNIPSIKSYDTESDSTYNILIMQLLGKNLETIFNEKQIFSLKTVCMIGYQIISILEYIHNRHIIHRDIKPDNFVVGLNELSQYLYIVDFGLAKKFRSSTSLQQIAFSNRNKIVGTARYASINALKGNEQSRRDDLEAAGYVLLYFVKGKLPWQGIEAKNKDEKYKKILEMKTKMSAKELCEGLPKEFETIIEYIRNLEYSEQPDYEKLRGYFNTMLRKGHNKFDYIYDWTTFDERIKRRVITPRSEIDSTVNKITNYSYRHFGDSRDENTDAFNYLSLKKYKTINSKNENNYDTIKEEINQANNILKIRQYTKNKEVIEEEEKVIITQRTKNKNNLVTNSNNNNPNNNKELVCCSFECYIF